MFQYIITISGYKNEEIKYFRTQTPLEPENIDGSFGYYGNNKNIDGFPVLQNLFTFLGLKLDFSDHELSVFIDQLCDEDNPVFLF